MLVATYVPDVRRGIVTIKLCAVYTPQALRYARSRHHDVGADGRKRLHAPALLRHRRRATESSRHSRASLDRVPDAGCLPDAGMALLLYYSSTTRPLNCANELRPSA
jgi:hypothetical protein